MRMTCNAAEIHDTDDGLGPPIVLPIEAAFTVTALVLVADRSAPGRTRLVDVATIQLGQSRPAPM